MSSEKLNTAISAINSGDKIIGVRLLKEILNEDQSNEKAWIWLATCVDGNEQKVYCLKKALQINPTNRIVITALSNLEKPSPPSAETDLTKKSSGLASSSNKPIANQDKSRIPNSTGNSTLNMPRSIPPVNTKNLNKSKNIYLIIIIFFLIIVCYGIFQSSSDSSTSRGGSFSIGDKAELYNGKDEVPVAVTKEVFDQVIHMSTANDLLGYAEFVEAGLVFRVESGTKVIIIDTTVTARQIRILEGSNIGESGWVPIDWLKK